MYSESVCESSWEQRDVLDRAGRGGRGVAMQPRSDGQTGLRVLDRRTSRGGTRVERRSNNHELGNGWKFTQGGP